MQTIEKYADWHFDEFGNFTGTIPQECVRDCTVPGQLADEAVKFWRTKLNFQVPHDLAVKYLAEFGAWDLLSEKNGRNRPVGRLWRHQGVRRMAGTDALKENR